MTSVAAHVLLISAVAAFGAFAGPAHAGDDSPPAPKDISPEQARCEALGEGYFAVKGSTSCMRISSYISAGAGAIDFGGAANRTDAPAPSHVVGFSENSAGVRIDPHFDAELGPSRIYVEINGTNVNAFSGGPAHSFGPAADR